MRLGPAGSATAEKPPGLEVSLRTVAFQPLSVSLTSVSAKLDGEHNVLDKEIVIAAINILLIEFFIFLPNYCPAVILITKLHNHSAFCMAIMCSRPISAILIEIVVFVINLNNHRIG